MKKYIYCNVELVRIVDVNFDSRSSIVYDCSLINESEELKPKMYKEFSVLYCIYGTSLRQ